MTEPNPTAGPEFVTFADVDRHQKRFCARRTGECLDVAALAGWPSLSCVSCSAYEPLQGLALRVEVVCLVLLGERMALIATGQRDHLGDPRPGEGYAESKSETSPDFSDLPQPVKTIARRDTNMVSTEPNVTMTPEARDAA